LYRIRPSGVVGPTHPMDKFPPPAPQLPTIGSSRARTASGASIASSAWTPLGSIAPMTSATRPFCGQQALLLWTPSASSKSRLFLSFGLLPASSPVVDSIYFFEVTSLFKLWERPHRSLARLARRHGSLISIRLGTVYAVVATSPEAAREVLQRRNASLAARRGLDAWRVMGHDENSMIALPPGAKWHALRKLAAAGLAGPRRLAEQAATREEKMSELVRRVADTGAPVAVARVAFAAVVGVLCQGMFSQDLEPALVDELTDVAVEASVLSGAPNVSDFCPSLAFADLQGVRRRAGKLVAWLYNIIDGQIEQRRCSRAAGGKCKNDLLDVMLDMEGEALEEGWVMNQEGNNLVFIWHLISSMYFQELVLASASLSAATEWTMAELLQNQPSMKKLKQEIASVHGTKPTMEEANLNQLPYLQAVINETLRLHPPVPFATGLAEAAVQVQGYNIPKGTATFVNIWGICRDSEVWDEPEKFMPERFLQNDINFFGTHFELISFSAGRRICPGLPLAAKLVPLMVGSLVHHFQWTLLPEDTIGNGIDMTEQFGLVMSMAIPLRAIAKKI
ncbi:Geraniol 8-hydroxylase, partial [Dichanthelium oligosanthes]